MHCPRCEDAKAKSLVEVQGKIVCIPCLIDMINDAQSEVERTTNWYNSLEKFARELGKTLE